MKKTLAEKIATHFFGKVIFPFGGSENDFGFEGTLHNCEMQVSVFFTNDNRIMVELYVTFFDGEYMEPDFIINGQTLEAVNAWIATEERLNKAG